MAYDDRKILLGANDGPEGITIYTSDEEGMVDGATTFPAVYVNVSLNGGSAHFGPFTLGSIYKQLNLTLSGEDVARTLDEIVKVLRDKVEHLDSIAESLHIAADPECTALIATLAKAVSEPPTEKPNPKKYAFTPEPGSIQDGRRLPYACPECGADMYWNHIPEAPGSPYTGTYHYCENENCGYQTTHYQ